MKLTNFKTKFVWTIGVLAIISLWIAFPLIFKYWVFKLLVTPPFTTEPFASLGPIGDIYGSLTALFTSATLIIVLYSAYLQRQANIDARQAMADQLRQARDATATQLKQARKAVDDQLTQAKEATAQQLAHAKELSDIQLVHAKEVATEQLKLVQLTHDAQIAESKHGIFASLFNILLNQKKAILDNANTGKEELKPKEIFNILCIEFHSLIRNEWVDYDCNNQDNYKSIFDHFCKSMDGNIKESFSFEELTSYFYMLIPLILIIKNSNVKDDDKKIYFMVISHSMAQQEQVTLLWYMLFSNDIKNALQDTGLIDIYLEHTDLEFIVRNFDKSCFSHPNLIEDWDKYLENQNPT